MKRSIVSLAALACLGLCLQAFATTERASTTTTRSGVIASPGIPKTPQMPQTPTPPPPAPSPMVTKLVSAKFAKLEIKVGESVAFKFDGLNLKPGGMCGGTVNWNDGSSKYDNMLADNGQWLTINKSFDKPGTYTALVTPKNYSGSPCVSDAPVSVSIKVNAADPLPPSQFTKLVITPMLDPKVRLISTKWVGTAPASLCFLVLNFGDGTSKQTGVGAVQPGFDTQHTYAPGTYTVSITPIKADQNCTVGPDAAPKTFTVE